MVVVAGEESNALEAFSWLLFSELFRTGTEGDHIHCRFMLASTAAADSAAVLGQEWLIRGDVVVERSRKLLKGIQRAETII